MEAKMKKKLQLELQEKYKARDQREKDLHDMMVRIRNGFYASMQEQQERQWRQLQEKQWKLQQEQLKLQEEQQRFIAQQQQQ